jgi:4-hydroxy-3-methylbut-2-enyl diphosphate reductase
LGRATELDPSWLEAVRRVGVTAGASTPEHLVEELIERLRALGADDVQTVETRVEDVFFAPPPMRKS